MVQTSVAVEGGGEGRHARLAVLAAAVLATLFAAGTVLAPALDGAGSPWGGVLRLVYAPACHQVPERSLTFGGASLAVCARCSGLYLGGVAGLFAGALWLAGSGRRPRPLWLAAAVAPTFLDALLPWIGLPQLAPVPRLLLAVPAGAVAALFLAVGIADLFSSGRPAPTAGPSAPHAPPVLEEANG